ncbi:hypothetical protein GP486_008078 [Trichoglossum hirsutum]|uniref:Uncharacterized protein n=1 Tax=Trichoglossum hirsutum TaxID=265104 RepID=A0A9P8I576_9PEZI|nr:hypothetical protein GP486_008078 [Trichoglossum hirsutum]
MTGIEFSYKYELVGGKTVYYISVNGSPYSGPYQTTKVIPAHDWIAKNTKFQGQLPLLQVQTNWWYQVVQPGSMTMWVSLKDDISVAQALGKLAQADKQGHLPITPEKRQANLKNLDKLVPGLSPGSGGLPLPVFPSQFFMTCTMTAVNAPDPMSTEVLYDWTAKLQRTRMFTFDQQSAVDAVLTTDPSFASGHVPGTTYLIQRYPDGTYKCDPPIPKIGPPPPDWAASDNAVIVATITDNPQLSPNMTTRIFHCPFDNTTQSQFWIWYSNQYSNDTPVVFMQTLPPAGVGTNLALADYQRQQTTPLIDLVSYSVPPTCKHK